MQPESFKHATVVVGGMSASVLVVGVSGSLRAGSLTRRVVAVALEGAAEAGAQTRILDLADYDLPFCDGRGSAERGVGWRGVGGPSSAPAACHHEPFTQFELEPSTFEVEQVFERL